MTAAEPVKSTWPVYSEAEIDAVANILRSGRVNAWTGGTVKEFEGAYADAIGCRHAVAVSNGSVALELALHGLGIGEGDEVIVSPRSFYASAACVPLVGARPVFCDVDEDSQAITARAIEAVLTPRTRAVVVVHLGGYPADMPEIMALAQKHNLLVVEDCAQAHGATIDLRPVGTFGDVATFSFCQDKIISTGGEGGLVVTDDEAAWQRIWSFKDHGKSYERVFHTEHPVGFRWLHESFGTNMRMTAIQAAIGLVQLSQLEQTIAERTERAERLFAHLAGTPGLRIPVPPDYMRHAYYRAYAFVMPETLRTGWTRDRILAEVAERTGLPCFSGSCPEIYRERAFQDAGFAPSRPLPVAQWLGETSLCFQIDPTLPMASIDLMGEALNAVMGEATTGAGNMEPPARQAEVA